MEFILHPTVSIETRFLAMANDTKRYWDGKGFNSPLVEKAKTLTEVEAIVVRYTWENVSIRSFDLETKI